MMCAVVNMNSGSLEDHDVPMDTNQVDENGGYLLPAAQFLWVALVVKVDVCFTR